MSKASRERERQRLHLFQRRGYPTWEAFRETQAAGLRAWLASPAAPGLSTDWVRDPYGRIVEPRRLFATAFDGEQVPMTFPEPETEVSSLLPEATGL